MGAAGTRMTIDAAALRAPRRGVHGGGWDVVLDCHATTHSSCDTNARRFDAALHVGHPES